MKRRSRMNPLKVVHIWTVCVLLSFFPVSSPQSSDRHDVREGVFLIASEDMRGTAFRQSVVLLVQHDDDGTMGLVINRTSDVTTGELLPQLENREQGEEPVFRGGPVETGTLRLLLLSDADLSDERVYEVLNGLYFTTSTDALEIALEHDDSAPVRVYAGYAGWAPGQLGAELRDGSWHVLPAEPEMVFDADPDNVWQELIEESRKILVRILLQVAQH